MLLTDSFSVEFFQRLEDYIYNKNNISDATKFNSFVSGQKYGDLFTLVLFFYFYHPDEFAQFFEDRGQFYGMPLNKNLPLLVVFDNIDHVEIEHQNSKFPQFIESLYQKVKQAIRKICDSKVNITIHFIFCLRDANCSLINRQLADSTTRYMVEFTPLNIEADMFSKRLSIASKNDIRLDREQCEFMHYVLKDEYTKKSFQPLFNFNIRKLAEFLCGVIEDSETTYIEKIKILSKNKRTRNASRGIEYFLIIRHLLNNDYLKQRLFLSDGSINGGTKGGQINPVRILLTNILNMSRYSLDVYTRTAQSNPVGLYSLFCSFNEVIEGKTDLYFEILTNLFLFHKENWCHLITFSNKQVFSEKDFASEKITLEKLFGQQMGNNISDQQRLDRIKIRLNPSGFAYLRDIVRHYEFFSLRANNPKPLFCSLDHNCKGNYIEFEFISNITRTFRLVRECIEHLIDFLNHLNNTESDDFSSSSHCFRIYNDDDRLENDSYDKKRPGLHSIRIIDTHISYIDTFRRFILNDESYWTDLEVSNIMSIRVDINKELIDILEEYVSFLIKINKGGDYTLNLCTIFEANINYIKASGYSDFKTSVNKGRNS